MTSIFRSLLFLFILQSSLYGLAYEVEWCGNVPEETISLLQIHSTLISQQNSPPATTTTLKYRAEADLDNLLRVLHSQGYYNAKIDFQYDFKSIPNKILVHIQTGPDYPFSSFRIIGAESNCFQYDTITLEDLDIVLGEPALPKKILEAEDKLLDIMEMNGYPLASITQREVIANQATHSIDVTLQVDSGPPIFFGPTTILGLTNVNEAFFAKKIAWVQGGIYDPRLVEETQNALEASGLFRSILIRHQESATENNQLPIEIEVEEARHRSVGVGLAYNTQRGVGVMAEWEHRNIRSMGEKLSCDLDLWRDLHEVSILYTQPDYKMSKQDLLWSLDFKHETTRGFREYSFSLSRMIEHQINDCTRISYGGMYKRLLDTHSDGSGVFNLLKTPFNIRWSNAKNLLDPYSGCTLNFHAEPSLNFPKRPFAYCINSLTASLYNSLTSDKRYILASKLLVGSIWGSSRRTIPASERFYEGTENTLRGYRFMTVSPLNDDHKPIGGRSMMILSEELRVRATDTLGWVLFYEVGNVYENPVPYFSRKVLQTVGYGLRYHTPVGPLRVDFAVPLNRRKHLDPRCQIYLSIGQAF